jgi:hypothetical protein
MTVLWWIAIVFLGLAFVSGLGIVVVLIRDEIHFRRNEGNKP